MNKISNPLVHIGLIIVLMVGFVYTPNSSSQDKRMLETDWSKHLAETVIHEEFGEYVLEDILPDRSRADISTKDTIWEVEYIDKWEQGVSQAIHYKNCSNKTPGLYLLMRGDKNLAEKDFLRCEGVVNSWRCCNKGFYLRTFWIPKD